MNTIHEHLIAGCRPQPLAHYLKALGVLRIVAEQADPEVRGAWHGEHFVLQTKLHREGLQQFFAESYDPSPLVTPWNGGSGFYSNDNRVAIEAIESSSSPRFSLYREVITAAKNALLTLDVKEKIDKNQKPKLLELCRGRFPDQALQWLDAAYLLAGESPQYPPLLGTGGNDGRLDFTNNFMQRILDLIGPDGTPTLASTELLRAALFDEPTDLLTKGAIGQFLPGDAGGPNAQTGFTADSLLNPWDYVLMLEGALLFAVAATRRFEHDTAGALSYPFTVRQAGVGYASASDADESAARAEMWLPLWRRMASLRELRRLLAEGRATVGTRTARNGIDFARAVATLGVDRGIDEFARYGFQVRNGLSYLATPLERVAVHMRPKARLLQDIDGWLDLFRRRAGGDRAPASATRALNRLERAIFDLCRRDDPDGRLVQEVLVALGGCERMMARSLRWTTESYLPPVPPLQASWLEAADDGSLELRLAASLASVGGWYTDNQGRPAYIPFRRQMEPVRTRATEDGMRAWWDGDAGREVTWTHGQLVGSLNTTFHRRIVLAQQTGASGWRDTGRVFGDLGDLADFIDGACDDNRLEELLWGCVLIDWSQRTPRLGDREPRGEPPPPASFALLKLCFPNPQHRKRKDSGTDASNPEGAEGPDTTREITRGAPEGMVRDHLVPVVPIIHRHASAGQGDEAAHAAIRRLRACDLPAAVGAAHFEGRPAERAAAALAWPLSPRQTHRLAKHVLITPMTQEEDEDPNHMTAGGTQV